MKAPPCETYPILKVLSQRRECLQKGILRVVLIIAGDLPDRTRTGARQACDIRLNEKATAQLNYFPNGIDDNGKDLNLFISIDYENEAAVYARVTTAALCRSGIKWFQTNFYYYEMFPHDAHVAFRSLGVIEEMMESNCFKHDDSSFRFHVRIEIDTITKVNLEPSPEIPLSTVQRIKDAIHDDRFGDIDFIVGGVEMFAHMDVLCEVPVFGQTFLTLRDKNKKTFDFPNTCPQTFKKLLISRYFKSPNLETYLEECD